MNDKKEWLRKCRELRLEIILCDEQIEDPSIYNSPWVDDRIEYPNKNDRQSITAVERIEQAKQRRAKAEQEFEKRRDAINNLVNGEERLILHLKYIKGYEWSDVQMWLYRHDYPMSERTMYYIHTRGINNIEILQ